jgi:hypothetical protein
MASRKVQWNQAASPMSRLTKIEACCLDFAVPRFAVLASGKPGTVSYSEV